MAYPQGPTAGTPQKPSKTGIIWAIVIFVVTAIIGIAMIVGAFAVGANAINDSQRVDAGAPQRITLGSGDQYVFAIADTNRELSRVTVSITDSSGDPVSLRSGTSFNANSSGSDGGVVETLGYIKVTNGPATYTVEVDGPPGSRVRIGEVPLGTVLGLLFGGIVIGGLGFVVALIILIVALVRRSKVKKANRAAAGGYGQPGAAMPPPAPGAPPAPMAPPATPAPTMAPPAPPAPPATPAPTMAPPAPPAPPAATPPPPAAPTPPPAAPSAPPAPPAPSGGTPPPPPPGPANPT